MQNLYEENLESNFLSDPGLQEGNTISNAIRGAGYVYGFEFLSKYSGHKNGGIISYSYSDTKRQFPEFNSGNRYPFLFDKRHQLKIFLYQKISTRIQFSLNWAYNTPSPKVYLEYLDASSPFIKHMPDIAERKNGQRATSYHRLDVSLSYRIKTTKAEHRIKLGCYNVYNQKNIAYYKITRNEQGVISYTPIHSISLIPSLFYSISF